MCGIVGYNGKKEAAPILLEGLEKLEYRGYDSAGISVRNGKGDPEVVKAKGRLANLCDKTNDGKTLKGTIGIGHTRWATHGEPSENNAHPHCSDDLNVVGVHNGIIENYHELKEKLIRKGYKFYSQTDSEVAFKLIDYYYKKYEQGPLYAITHAMSRINGSYAFAVMFKHHPDVVYAARKESPLVVGLKEDEAFLASDVTPIIKYTKKVFFLDNFQVAKIGKGEVEFFDIDQEPITIEPTEIKWDISAAERGGYEHFMIKEIHEQPKAVLDTLNSCVKEDRINLEATGLTKEAISTFKNIHIVACGSAYHVGKVGEQEEESFHDKEEISPDEEPEVELEFPNLDDNTAGTLKIYTHSGFEPYEFIGQDGSTVVGVDMYMMQLCADIMKMAISKKYITYNDLYYLDEKTLVGILNKKRDKEFYELWNKFKTIKKKDIPDIELITKNKILKPLVNGVRMQQKYCFLIAQYQTFCYNSLLR